MARRRCFTALSAEAERLEADWASGREFDILQYTTAANCLRRILETIGLKRVARPVNDGSAALTDYFASPKVRKRNHRSKVSNGVRLFQEPVDGRTTHGRRFADLVSDMVVDLGGRDYLSEGERQLVRRAATPGATGLARSGYGKLPEMHRNKKGLAWLHAGGVIRDWTDGETKRPEVFRLFRSGCS